MGGLFAKLPVVKFDWDKTITGKDRKLIQHANKNQVHDVLGASYWVFSLITVVFVLYVSLLRITELFSIFATSLSFLCMWIFLIGTCASLLIAPPLALTKLGRRVTVIIMIIIALKRECDWDLAKNMVSVSADDGGRYDMKDKLVIITGANSGVGLGAVELFASYGADVVMACRSIDRCNASRETVERRLSHQTSYVGSLHTELLDLSDLVSVQSFAYNMKQKYSHIDVLVNNAGSTPAPGARTAQGFELSWGSMHLGHHALTRWLLPLLLKPRESKELKEEYNDGLPNNSLVEQMKRYSISDSARVVTVSSDAFLAGSFHDSLLFGNSTGLGDLHGEIMDNCDPYKFCCPIGNCPDSNSYARSKLSNVLQSYELQKRIDAYAYGKPVGSVRRVVTSALHPGTVATNIHPFFSSSFTNWPMRSHLEAARLVVYGAMEEDFLPATFIDSACKPHDLFDYFSSKDGLDTHVAAWPEAKQLPFYEASLIESQTKKDSEFVKYAPAGVRQGMSYHQWIFKTKALLHTGLPRSGVKDFVSSLPMSLFHLYMNVSIRIVDIFRPVLATLDHFDIFGFRSVYEYDKREEQRDIEKKLLEKETVSARLWDLSAAVVDAFEKGDEFLQKPLTSTSTSLQMLM